MTGSQWRCTVTASRADASYFPAETAGRSDADLQLEVGTSYQYAVSALRITHLPVLVRWVKADVAWARGLRDQAITAVWFNETGTPNATAADLLALLAAAPLAD